MPSRALLSTAEVAARLGCTTATVRNYVAAGRLKPAQKVPTPTGTYLFTEAAVRRLEAARAA